MKHRKVFFIGAGPGDPELLTLKGKSIIERADVLIYAGSLVNPQVLNYKKKEATVYNSASMNLKEIVALISKEVKKGKTVARIHTGDPAIYGAIQEQISFLEKRNISYEVIPGVSSVFAAAAALKKELTVPERSQTVILTRISGRTKVPSRESIDKLAQSHATMAIFLSVAHIEEVVEQLLIAYPPDTPVAVVHKASWPDEKVVRGTLRSIAGKVHKAAIKRQALILVGSALGDTVGTLRSKLYHEGFAHGYRKNRQGKKKSLAIVTLTKSGAQLGTELKKKIPAAHLFVPRKLGIKGVRVKPYTQPLHDLFGELVHGYRGFICIMATGIVVRTITPFLTHKSVDPAVVVLDEKGRFAISLVSGHLGGANELAEKVASLTGGKSVITTATDVHSMPAIDLLAKQLDCSTLHYTMLKGCNYAVLHGEKVGIYPDTVKPYFPVGGKHKIRFYKTITRLLASDSAYKIIISNKQGAVTPDHKQAQDTTLLLTPRNLVVGIGCNRSTSCAEIEDTVKKVLGRAQLSFQAIKKIATVSIKSNEKGLLAFARKYNFEIEFHTPEQLNKVVCPTPPSKNVLNAVGSKGVCEPSALLSAGVTTLLCAKKKTPNVTVAVAEIPLERLLAEGKEKK
jgi:precorrin-4 C11-methyltransferase